MPVSYLTNSVAEMLAAALNTLTGGSFSHLTMSEDEMLARVVTEMTGQSYSHLTTSRETLWELLLTQAASDGITFDRLTQSNEQIAEIIANNVSAGGGEEYEGPLDLVPGALWACSMRALADGYAGQAIRVKQGDAPEEEQDFAPTTNHAVDPDAVDAFLVAGGGSGFGVTFYDQVGIVDAISPSSPWVADAGGLPAFDCVGSAPFTVAPILFPAGSRTFSLVVDYTQNGNGTYFVETTGGGVSLNFSAYYNNPNDLYVYAQDDQAHSVTWVADTALTTGRHLLEARIDANGDVTILVDGVDVNAVVVDGASFALPESTSQMQFPSFGADVQKYYELIVWPSVASAAQGNIADYYGISLG